MSTAILTVDRVFSEALLRAAGNERAGYLDIACASNPELRQRVEQLLLAYGDAESFLESPAAGVDATLEHTITEQPGTQIGPYKLLQEIGQGGMGVVYMAEQLQPVQRKIALKIIKVGMDTAQVVARFQAERQALALMNHPNIAKVFDAGTTESGRPYFVMELVRGIPITEFCDAQKLTLRERMELFVTVCEAVHHAHQKGIIHRDLKPSNLLVELHDVKAVPKVIDFGIAKSTNQKLTERTLFTNFSQMIGTPMYMSPEQSRLSGLDIDIRSDIYSLGVLLYELLTGTTPLTKETLSQVGYDELRRKIQEEEPPRASARISTLKAEVLSTLATNQRADSNRISQHLRGELDWIVAKALEKDRTRRYQSTLEFADDITRFLNGEHVEAHPPSVAYRLTKIVRRYRTALALAAVLLLVLISATGISVRYALVADRASRAADAGRQDAIDQRTIADKERGEAETQRNEALRLQAEAVQQRETIRKNLYTADMRLAALDLKSENIARLHAKLPEHIPKAGTPDYRSWEWYYLQASGRMNEKTFLGHANQVEDVAWSPNGKFIGSVGYDGAVIWNAATGKIEKRLGNGLTFKRAAAWSPDSMQFAWGSVGNENAIRIWNSATDEKHVMLGHKESLGCLAWSPDGLRLASTAGDSTCRIWDIATKECIKTLNYEKGFVNGVAWHPEGKYIATAGSGLRVWNPVDGTLIPDLDQTQDFLSLGFTADGAHLIAVDNKGQCNVIDTDTWKVAAKFTAHLGACESVAVFGNTKFATSGFDGVVKVWSLPECKNFATLYGHDAAVNAVCWDPSGNYLASVSSDKRVQIWNLAHHSIFKRFAVAPSPAIDFTQLRDSSLFGVILESQEDKLLDLETASLKDDGIEKSVFDLRFVAPKTDIEALVKLAHLEINKQHSDRLPGFIQSAIATSQTNPKISVVWSPDRSRVACMEAGFIRVWSIVKQQQICSWRVNGFGQLKWAQDSQRLGFAGPGMESDGGNLANAGWAYIFDTDSGKTVHRMQHGNLRQAATAIEWDPSGNRIASGGPSGDVICWDAQTGKQISNGQILRATLTCLAWSPDQSRLAVAGDNARVKIIDPESCEELLELSDGNSSLKKLTWSMDGQRLFGIEVDGNVVIWDASRAYKYVLRDEFTVERLLREANERIKQTKYAEALTLLDELLNRNPDNLAALQLRAWECNRRLRNREAVIADYKSILDIDAENTPAWNNLAYYLNMTNRISEAIAAYTKGIESLGEGYKNLEDTLLTNRSQAYVALGQFSDAKQDLLAVIQQEGQHLHQNKLLALLHLHSGERSAYSALCERVMNEASESNVTGNEFQAILICILGANAIENYEKAIQLAQKLHAMDRTNKNTSVILGAILFRDCKYKAALPIFTNTVVVEEGAVTLHGYFLAMCHQKLGNNDEARNWLKQANAADDEASSTGNGKLWSNRTTYDLLRAEATKLINGDN